MPRPPRIQCPGWMKVIHGGGLIVRAGSTSLWLDSSPGLNGLSLVTHAHADHSPRGLSRAITTPETASILNLLRGRSVGKTIKFGEVLRIGDVEVAAHPSGHVFGSSQFLIDYGGERLVYTGDLNTYDSLILSGAAPVEADKLIVEATYGSPRYIFPPREEVYARIVSWILGTINRGEIPAFKVYALGKAQEIIGIVNSYLDIPVVASWTVARISEKHREHGLRLEYLSIDEREGLEALRQGECVYVSNRRCGPPSSRRLRWATATGWALRYRFSNYDAAFPLSGHSDFPALVEYVRGCGAREVYVVHGFAEEFARHLRRMGLRASAVAP